MKPVIESKLGELADSFLSKKENELREQLAWLVDRNILVIYQTVKNFALKPNGEKYEFTVSQRFGLALETERYIQELETRIREMSTPERDSEGKEL